MYKGIIRRCRCCGTGRLEVIVGTFLSGRGFTLSLVKRGRVNMTGDWGIARSGRAETRSRRTNVCGTIVIVVEMAFVERRNNAEVAVNSA